MIDVLITTLPYAAILAVSPMTIVAMILVLMTDKPIPNGFTFLAGWYLSLIVAGFIALLFVGPPYSITKLLLPNDIALWAKIIIGILFILIVILNWQNKPRKNTNVKLPKWVKLLEKLTPVKSFFTAFVMGVISPKNLILSILATMVILESGIIGINHAVVWTTFAAIGTIGVAIPLLFYVVVGKKSKDILNPAKNWMIKSNWYIMTGLFLLLGIKLIYEGVSGLIFVTRF